MRANTAGYPAQFRMALESAQQRGPTHDTQGCGWRWECAVAWLVASGLGRCGRGRDQHWVAEAQ
eukprot:6328767-Karenia_brevis.AAC.1